MLSKLVRSLAILLLLGVALAAPAGAATKGRTLVRAINRVRAQHGLRPLRLDRALGAAAQEHSLRMARTRVFAHSPRLPIPARARTVGENLAWIPGDRPDDVVALWLRSPHHRANLLNPRFHLIGVGDVNGLVTADFAG